MGFRYRWFLPRTHRKGTPKVRADKTLESDHYGPRHPHSLVVRVRLDGPFVYAFENSVFLIVHPSRTFDDENQLHTTCSNNLRGTVS